ncbi:MAG: type II 3-dehydroquinate dehydratase [Bacteroidota bacterium]|nr:type II 3-dehydroquinate dehydratase [Bacteroidota bacterium]MDP4231692.1 type II 3-dehydroquinate dehydratase [Bacteroidota bacterium]MDP4237623.1 type II 3-dehydroquinate dehydratase [Bacteroidota bacterium]
MNILILHGPNLNLLGEREPAIYGSQTLEDINNELQSRAEGYNISLRIEQSNHEGVLIDRIQENRKWADALIINPGAFTHYSYAIRDAIAAFNKPTIEVHLSDLSKREEFRKHSVLSGLENVRRIMGKGAAGYFEALDSLAIKE